jgi:hypothetical protein
MEHKAVDVLARLEALALALLRDETERLVAARAAWRAARDAEQVAADLDEETEMGMAMHVVRRAALDSLELWVRAHEALCSLEQEQRERMRWH